MSDTETQDGQCWPPSPDTPQGRAQIRVCALDMAIRTAVHGEEAHQIVHRAQTFRDFLTSDSA